MIQPVLGIDIGTTNTKAVLLVPTEARPIAIATCPTPATGRALLEAVFRLTRTVLAGRPAPVAVGLASMAETGAILHDDSPAGDLLRWNRAEASDLGQVPGLYEATGVPNPAKTPVAMLRSLRAAGDDRLDPGIRWGGVADLVGLALAGRLATHHTLAARSLATRMTPEGRHELRFDADLLDLAGLARAQFPEILAPDEPLGAVSVAGAEASGIPEGTPVVLAGHDHAVAAWSVGVRGAGGRADSLGTTEAVYGIVAGDPDVPAARVAGLSIAPTLAGDAVAVLGATATAGAVLEWLGVLRALDLSTIDRRASTRIAANVGLLFHPYLRGRQSPAPDAAARARVTDLEGRPARLPEDDADALAVVTTGLALQARWLFDTIDATAGASDEPVVVIEGPLARSATWRAARDAILDRPTRAAAADEAVAAGAALRAAVLTAHAPADLILPVGPVHDAAPAAEADRQYTAFLATTASSHDPEQEPR